MFVLLVLDPDPEHHYDHGTRAQFHNTLTASSIAQWYSAGFECGKSRVQSPVKDHLLDSILVQCWLRVREIRGSITSQGPPPRQPSGRVLASSAGGPGFNPQSRTTSSIAQWQSARIECGRSRVQSPVKDHLLDSLVVQCWHRVREVPGSIPSQGPRHTKDVIKLVPGSSLVQH